MARLIVDLLESEKSAIQKEADRKNQSIKALVLESLKKNNVKLGK